MRFLRIVLLMSAAVAAHAQDRSRPVPLPAPAGLPSVAFIATTATRFPVDADSNSPLFWDDGILYVLNSVGHPTRSYGPDVKSLGHSQRINYHNEINGGRWMEAVVRAGDGTVYGFYHNEPSVAACPRSSKTVPRIGAARSHDNGLNWQDLGIVLEAPSSQIVCGSENHYFMGGHGDFSVMLDQEERYLYFFFSNYSGLAPQDVSDRPAAIDQGVAVARMRWDDRNQPAGKVYKYFHGTWDREEGLGGLTEPVFPARVSWHRASADSYWGPSIHWNTHLKQYVMLLNRAIDSGPGWKQEGIYISFSLRLDDPGSWSTPYRIHEGVGWYPQVVGEKRIQGTDKTAGQTAVFFNSGRALATIVFFRPGETGFCPPEDAVYRCRNPEREP